MVLAGQYVFWHSSAHILGEAMERHYGGHLCYGPPIEEGFYYDMWMEGRYVLSNTLFPLDTQANNVFHYKGTNK